MLENLSKKQGNYAVVKALHERVFARAAKVQKNFGKPQKKGEVPEEELFLTEEAKVISIKVSPFKVERQQLAKSRSKGFEAIKGLYQFEENIRSLMAEEINAPPLFSKLPGEEDEEAPKERKLLSDIFIDFLSNTKNILSPDYRPAPPSATALPKIATGEVWYDEEGRPPPPKVANLPEIEQQPLWFDEEGRTIPRPPEKKLKLPQIELEDWFDVDVPEPPPAPLALPPIELEPWVDVEETINFVPPPPATQLQLPKIEMEEWFDVEEEVAAAPWPPLPVPSVDVGANWKGAGLNFEPPTSEVHTEVQEKKPRGEKGGKPPLKPEVKKPDYKSKASEAKPRMNLTQNVNGTPHKNGNLVDEDAPATASPIKRNIAIDVEGEKDPTSNPYLSTPKKITQLTPKEPGASRLSSGKSADGKTADGKRKGSIFKTKNEPIKESLPEFEASPAKRPDGMEENNEMDRIQKNRRPSKMKDFGAKHIQKKKTLKVQEKSEKNSGQTQAQHSWSLIPMDDSSPTRRVAEKKSRAQMLMEMENPSFFELQRIREEGQSAYEDDSFPPNVSSLLKNSQMPGENVAWTNFQWMRIGDIFSIDSISLGDRVDPTGMCMNNMVNHFFVGALSALAERPSRVQRLFGEQSPNKEGVYHVMLNIRGIWRAVIIDDLVPVIKEHEDDIPEIAFLNPVYKQKNQNVDIWFMLIEKAWAKVFHRYEALERGNTANFLRDLTGAPSYELNIDGSDPDAIWETVEEAFRKNYIVVAHKKNEGKEEEEGVFAGSGQETFTLVQSGLATDSKGKEHKVCILRGHHEAYKVKKNVIDCADMLTQLDVAFKKYKVENTTMSSPDDNLSHCGFDEFINEFSKLTICNYNEGFEYLSVTVRHHRRAFSIVQFTLEEFTHQCCIETSQIDMMFFGESLQKKGFYNYSPTRIFIVKESKRQPETFKLINCVLNPSNRNTQVKMDLKPGNYFAVVAVDWRDKVHDLVINYYGSTKPSIFGRVPMSTHPNLLNSAFYSMVSKGGEKKAGSTASVIEMEITLEELGMTIASIENKSKKPVVVSQKISKGTRWSWGNVVGTERLGEDVLDQRTDLKLNIDASGKRIVIGVWVDDEGKLSDLRIQE